eukprot:m.262653 g.262653  ORF g.262653 m.262653 type:complete len:153 (+) comp46504_c0_seq1:427-885(+)
MDEVAPRLFLGGKKEAKALLSKHSCSNCTSSLVDHVLNVSDKMFYMPKQDGVEFEYVPLNDFGKTELTPEILERCFEFIDRGLAASGGGVLVHCTLGVNRSAVIVTAHLMRSSNDTPTTILTRLKKIRSRVDPNQIYRQQLEALWSPSPSQT